MDLNLDSSFFLNKNGSFIKSVFILIFTNIAEQCGSGIEKSEGNVIYVMGDMVDSKKKTHQNIGRKKTKTVFRFRIVSSFGGLWCVCGFLLCFA